MAIMIPDAISPDIKSNAERRIFEWFKNAPYTDKWVVLHSLGIATHQRLIHGETDFLVIAPNLGMFALEVKGGRVQRKLGKWYFTNRYGETNVKIRGPFDQAWEGIYSIRDSVRSKLDINHKHLYKMIIGIGVMFPDIDYDSVGIDEEQWQVFDINDGKDVKSYIERIARGTVNKHNCFGNQVTDDMYPDEDDVRYITSILMGDFVQDIPLLIKQRYAEEGFLKLTKEQSLCLEQLKDNPRALIRGTAGTGKTLLALEAAKNAISNGERVAFFCFNRLLGDWLKSIFDDLPFEQQPMFIGTFHSYMIKLLNSRGIKVSEPSDLANLEQYYKFDLPNKVVEVCKSKPVVYDKIIIDEAQDLVTNEYLDVLDYSLLGGLARGHWLMFGDFSMQSIYSNGKREIDYIDLIQKKAFFALYKLTKNCRNTKKICIDIENILGIPENSAFEDTVDMPSVNHITYNNCEEQKNILIEKINLLLSQNIKKKDIVILSPRKRIDSVVGKLKDISINDYSVSDLDHIRFSTLHGFKGLESSTVILTDIENYNDEKQAYVGLSRARFCLYVLETQKATDERNALFFKRRIANG